MDIDAVVVVSLAVHFDETSNSYSLYKPRPPALRKEGRYSICDGPGGYDEYEYQFVDSRPFSSLLPVLEDMMFCKICYLLSRDPYLSCCCGHTFCKSCLDALTDSVDDLYMMCPVCREKDFQTVKNQQVERAIKRLCVSCTNSVAGCTWQGELNYIKVHLESCQFEKIACNDCGNTVERQHLHEHLKNECLGPKLMHPVIWQKSS